jgi:hypothetical protein
MKIGIITSRERYPMIARALPEDAEADVRAIDGNLMRGQLVAWDTLSYDIAIIDDDTVVNEEGMIEAITWFQSSPVLKGHMRLVFLAGRDRAVNDAIFPMLAQLALYDLVIPARGDNIPVRVAQLIERPARRNECMDFLLRIETSAYNGAQTKNVKPYVSASTSTADTLRYAAIGKIAVITSRPKGGSTTFSVAAARSLELLGQDQAIVTNARTCRNYYSQKHEGDPGEDFVLKLNGVTFYPEKIPATRERAHTHILYDLGCEGSDSDRVWMSPEFATANVKVCIIPAGSPDDYDEMAQVLGRADSKDVRDWCIGITFTDGKRFERVAELIRRKSPGAMVFPATSPFWPLDVNQVVPGIEDILKTQLPAHIFSKTEEVLLVGKKRKFGLFGRRQADV